MPEEFIFLGRTAGILSGMCTGLDPAFDPWSALQPYAQKLMSSDGVIRAVWDEVVRVGTALLRTPGRLEGLLAQLERGELGVRTPDLGRSIDRLERRIYRSTLALVSIAACVSGTQLLLGGRDVAGWVLLGAGGALFAGLLLAR
jgi:predicted unusual protein kinase regulating ubiquinone biosynthesis (AarF/ABC1/UbiB family)